MTEYLLDVFLDGNVTRRFSLSKDSWNEIVNHQAEKAQRQITSFPIGSSWSLIDSNGNILYLNLSRAFGIKLWTRERTSNPLNNPEYYEDPLS